MIWNIKRNQYMMLLLSRPDFYRCTSNTALKIQCLGEMGVDIYGNNKYSISYLYSRLSTKYLIFFSLNTY